MSDKLTGIKGFGEGDPKPEKGKDGHYRGHITAPSGRKFEITKSTSAKSKALKKKTKKLEVYSDKATRIYRPSLAQVSTDAGKRDAEKNGRKLLYKSISFK